MESITLKIQPRVAEQEETLGYFFFEAFVDAKSNAVIKPDTASS